MADLFDTASRSPSVRGGNTDTTGTPVEAPLADRMRPVVLADVVGQDHILGEGGTLLSMIRSGSLGSIIFWGPPGVGKTTIARLLAKSVDMTFVQISAIFSGVPDLRKIFDAARLRKSNGRGTLLFVDEIHRFNRAQQDAFLPLMEDGTIVLVGATTENPSFELNSAILSRASVLTLRRLDEAALALILERFEGISERMLPLTAQARSDLIGLADGDGRTLLNLVEQLPREPSEPLDGATLAKLVSRRAVKYDKSGDSHYNLISALHKSVRGSDPDAALYWLARMLSGGEDPRYLARRITRMAVEDIGLADPQAQRMCLDAWQTYERLGSPEGELALGQAVIHLALAPKSNAAYVAFKAAMNSAKETGSLDPPRHILNAPTNWMKEQGFGEGYEYDHDAEGGVSGQNYFPDDMEREVFYEPTNRGHEQGLRDRLAELMELRSGRDADRND